ncbi:carbamoyl-phosphate synthase (glutamine-hydrolyzing) large subunit [Amphibacillus cookii]|uniref:carbamoyl-phosphate synthase (glutamine-hydrolyzing) large subunit n=1 Tax=Amphibacillus cookii TaxID=767787 RepID=UPI001959BF6E|nr:carbamoyl-phosphate synthase (glutamine-hydrolyzing) large subunit [Amphibacillus cookii]MBM7542953.1 carbamoyl-phosphate synthase large subunit [Amphibacillus cookii]
MPKLTEINKVLVIGSGPIVIGQAAEFDYAGTQACLALKEEGIEVILVNNNPATIMTDENIADQIYLEPLTLNSVSKIIAKEKPDGLLPTLGGQTGLNLAMALTDAGVLAQHQVTLLGTPLETIQKGEDREIFKSMMKEINEPIAESQSVESVTEACEFATQIGYPLIVRPAYTLGGAGGGIANNQSELMRIVKNGLHQSPIHQVLIEQSVKGWKEIEYEVMRDGNDTCVIICNMENFDPVGVHTGDSIVVAPTQTLTDQQHQMLRSSSVKVIRELGVIGGCNIQFALDPTSDDYIIIEVNPRVSRSSALASKATGYPIARIAAKLALGYHLDEVLNPITGDTYASFEPAIDYIALKIPRWPFDKFYQADRSLGTQMKATGEVMALARNFPAALNKAIRSLELGLDSLVWPGIEKLTNQQLEAGIVNPTDQRLFLLAELLRRGYSVSQLKGFTGITKYFLEELKCMIDFEIALSEKGWEHIAASELKQAKQYSIPNSRIASLFAIEENSVLDKNNQLELSASYKMVDTCAAEFSADTPYFYSSWQEYDEVESLDKNQRVVVLGSGPIRIGQGVEFDYCSVHAAFSLKDQGVAAIVINNNPETVSTDYSTADHLYFEPLTVEDVLHVVNKEQADGVLIQYGGQTAINLAEGLSKHGVNMIGTDLSIIEKTEDREQFYQLLNALNIPHIPGATVMSVADAKAVAAEIGYPVLMRPSYVIGGQGMVVLKNERELADYLGTLIEQTPSSRLFPLLIDQFIIGNEVEIDAVCDGEDIIIPGIFEHVERAGVHSGDSVAIFPAPSLTSEQKATIEDYTKKISQYLNIKGIINIQFVMSEDRQTIYVLEVNPRASRTVPIASKITGVEMIDLATKVQMGKNLRDQGWMLGLHKEVPFYAVKMPIFSSTKLPGVDPILAPEMKSTGEAIGIGKTVEAALAKAFGWKEEHFLPITEEKGLFLSITSVSTALIKALQETTGKVAATEDTAKLLLDAGYQVEHVLTEQEVLVAIENEQFNVICDQQSQNIRAQGLTVGAVVLSRAETLIAYLNAWQHEAIEPSTLKAYRKGAHDLNKAKVEV